MWPVSLSLSCSLRYTGGSPLVCGSFERITGLARQAEWWGGGEFHRLCGIPQPNPPQPNPQPNPPVWLWRSSPPAPLTLVEVSGLRRGCTIGVQMEEDGVRRGEREGNDGGSRDHRAGKYRGRGGNMGKREKMGGKGNEGEEGKYGETERGRSKRWPRGPRTRLQGGPMVPPLYREFFLLHQLIH